MNRTQQTAFSPIEFLSKAGIGRTIVQRKQREAFFSQGEKADSVFYLQKGRAKITVVSKSGKEATIALLSQGEFIGEEAIAAVVGQRLATASWDGTISINDGFALSFTRVNRAAPPCAALTALPPAIFFPFWSIS